MPKATVFDMAGKQVGEIELSEAIFGIEPNESVVHDMVKGHLANLRQGTQSALTRAEVSGGGKKPWRQKGTGRARQGSIRAPQWTHGGIVFAPKPRSYRYHPEQEVPPPGAQERPVREGGLRRHHCHRRPRHERGQDQDLPDLPERGSAPASKPMVVTAEPDVTIYKSARNIPGVNHHLCQRHQCLRHPERRQAGGRQKPPLPRSRRCSHNEPRLRHHPQAHYHRAVHGSRRRQALCLRGRSRGQQDRNQKGRRGRFSVSRCSRSPPST